jgi:hypothetical protein
MSDSTASDKKVGSVPIQIAASLLDHMTLDDAVALLGAVSRIFRGNYTRPIEIQQTTSTKKTVGDLFANRGYDMAGRPVTIISESTVEDDDNGEVEPDHIDQLLSDIRNTDNGEGSFRKGRRGFMGPAATLRERYGPTYHDSYYWREVITDQYIPHLKEIGRKSFSVQDFYDWVHKNQVGLLSESDKAMLSSSVRWRNICANIFSNARRSEGTAEALGISWTGYFFKLIAGDEPLNYRKV